MPGMGRKDYRPLEHTPDTLPGSEPAPAANDTLMGRPADLGRPETDLRTARGFGMGVLIGAGLWIVVAVLVWLALR